MAENREIANQFQTTPHYRLSDCNRRLVDLIAMLKVLYRSTMFDGCHQEEILNQPIGNYGDPVLVERLFQDASKLHNDYLQIQIDLCGGYKE